MDIFESNTQNGYPIIVPSYINGYHILKILNKGSTCVVVLVEDQETKEKYAAKIISKADAIENNTYQLIIKEIDILKSISHENIVKLYDDFEIENDYGECFIVLIMEYCQNGDFLSYITTNTIDVDIKISMFYKTLLAIKYLHDKEISHGDFKSENILLDSHFVPKLCGFCYARTKSIAGNESKHGTLYYAAPELFERGIFNTIKTDIYAIGITLYSIVELTFPFKNGDENHIMKQIIRGKFSMHRFRSTKTY